jgi:glycosyltransferase involved in cell wall biosynthesis
MPDSSLVKPLIIAEHASAQFGGEALIPFQYFKYLRRLNIDVHLLVHERTGEELREAFPNDVDRLHFVSDSLINIWCFKLGKVLPERLANFTLGAMSHFDTQIRQRRIARTLIRENHFNLVHEPIPVSPKQPSIMFGLGAPVIVGPMNGGMDYPPNYNLASSVERAIVAILRWGSAFWNEVLPGKKQAVLLLVANPRTREALPSNLRGKWIRQFTENGVDLDRFSASSGRAVRENVQIIYVGRLVDWKRVDLLLSACERLVGKVGFQLHIVGDGIQRVNLESQVRRVSLQGNVQFHGFLPQGETAELLRNSDIMVLPSMRECGGAVVLEAMASEVSVIATDWGGPADYITEGTGILIPPGKPEEFVERLAVALAGLAENPNVRQRMGQAGRLRVQQLYDWRVKAEALLRIYNEVLNAASIEG